MAARRARDRRHPRRAEAPRAHARADDRQALRARLLELDARRGARQRGRPAQRGAPPGAARSSWRAPTRRRSPRAGRSRSTARRSRRWSRSGIETHPRIQARARASSRRSRAASAEHPVILATGPLTGDALAADLARVVGARAPRVLRRHRAHRARRLDRLGQGLQAVALGQGGRRRGRGERLDATALGDEAYVNCPFDEAAVRRLRRGRRRARRRSSPRASRRRATSRGACPIEVMASRGDDDARVRADEARRPDRSAHAARAPSPSSSSARRTRRRRRTTSSASRRG